MISSHIVAIRIKGDRDCAWFYIDVIAARNNSVDNTDNNQFVLLL